MASVTTAQLSADLNHALQDFPVTLTISSPSSSSGDTYSATRNVMQVGYFVEMNGREATVDTSFYLNISGLSSYPGKGWVFSDGSRSYKVADQKIDMAGVGLKLDCISQYQAGS
jgi:hypothetical protein